MTCRENMKNQLRQSQSLESLQMVYAIALAGASS